jgi:hypothetical protein
MIKVLVEWLRTLGLWLPIPSGLETTAGNRNSHHQYEHYRRDSFHD